MHDKKDEEIAGTTETASKEKLQQFVFPFIVMRCRRTKEQFNLVLVNAS